MTFIYMPHSPGPTPTSDPDIARAQGRSTMRTFRKRKEENKDFQKRFAEGILRVRHVYKCGCRARGGNNTAPCPPRPPRPHSLRWQ